MRATAKLKVPDNLDIDLTLSMNVGEMRALLSHTQTITHWPMNSFRSVLQQALHKADAAYQSEHVIEG